MPCDYSRYPANWKTEIVPRIKARAGDRCENCGAANYSTSASGKRVVLTVAHLDNPDPMDCRDENLALLCQKCHNSRDGKMRAEHATVTRRERKRQRLGDALAAQGLGQGELF